MHRTIFRRIDTLPYAVPCSLPVGALDAGTAEDLFQSHFDPHGTYSVASDGFARLHTSEQTAEYASLGHYYQGRACNQNHITTRRKRRNKPLTECDECRRQAKSRKKARR